MFLPISGFVWFYPEEIKVIDHPAFQRLGKVYQLGQAYLVFRGATHKRIEHVLGAVNVAQRMINAIEINADKAAARGETDRRAGLNFHEERFVRLSALLHDIGHLPSGHTLEDELCLFGKHDEDERLDLVLGETQWGPGVKSERLAAVIDHSYGPYLPEDLREANVTPTDVVRLLVRKKPKNGNGSYDLKKDKYAKQQLALEKSPSIRLNVCTNIVANTLCADLLDYIYRDWYDVGKPFEREDRIYQYMEIRNPGQVDLKAEVPNDLRRDHSDVFVLNLGHNVGHEPKIRTDGISAILSLLEKRYELAETVLYHKTKLAAGAMLGRALYELWANADPAELPKLLLGLSDEELIEFGLAKAIEKVSEGDQSAIGARNLLSRLKARKLYRAFHTIRRWDLQGGQRAKLTQLFSPKSDAQGLGAKNRSNAASQFERDFELPVGSIVISLTDVKPKIAQVQIRVNNETDAFASYEERMVREGGRGLSGGHLEAQIQRFSDMWRCDFFVDKATLIKLEEEAPHKIVLLRAAIRDLYVSPHVDPAEADWAMQRLAQSYVSNENQRGRNNIRLQEKHQLLAARGDPSVAESLGELERHPQGPRAMRTFWMVDGDK
jgi:HD superfamily phosphohydrolase